jgi:Concanavalin A-like lectin/glucanases superfamily
LPGPILIQPQQGGEAPLAYELAPGQTIEPTLATAVFDGTAASGPFIPTIAFYAQNGRLQGRAPCGVTVQPGDTAEVTFFPFAPPTVEGGGGSALDDLIVSLRPSAWYKLDESLGLVAHDSSANHFDANSGSLATAPLWQQTPLPPGTPSAGFESTPDKTVSANTAFPAISSGDLSAVAWVRRTNTGLAICIGQGDPISNADGWQLYIQASTGLPHNTPSVQVTISGVSTTLAADAAAIVGQDYMLATVFESGVWSIFVNGVRQTNTLTGSPVPVTGLSMGQGTLATVASDMDLSYVQVYDYALTDAEILRLFRGG